MSVSRKSEISPMRTHESMQEEGRDGGRDSLSSPTSRQRSEEELQMLNVDANQLQHFMARPVPVMPITPPLLSTAFFSFQDRRPSIAASIHGSMDPKLSEKFNSDLYLPESTTTMGPNVRSSSPRVIQTSYTRMLSLNALHLSSSTDPGSEDLSSIAFAPSSFPSSNPILPIAPHMALESREFDTAVEMASVFDDSGAVWKRHTRVYGGGVCLACLASGGHGNDGGFYGENVPLDQRR